MAELWPTFLNIVGIPLRDCFANHHFHAPLQMITVRMKMFETDWLRRVWYYGVHLAALCMNVVLLVLDVCVCV